MTPPASSLSVTFAEWLMLKRRQVGLRQIDVAEKLGKSHKTVSSWERGEAVPRLTPKEMQVLCEILSCTLADLAQYDTAA